MLVTCYLVSAALFYLYTAKRAPIEEENVLLFATERASCEVVELFPRPAVQEVAKAA